MALAQRPAHQFFLGFKFAQTAFNRGQLAFAFLNKARRFEQAGVQALPFGIEVGNAGLQSFGFALGCFKLLAAPFKGALGGLGRRLGCGLGWCWGFLRHAEPWQ